MFNVSEKYHDMNESWCVFCDYIKGIPVSVSIVQGFLGLSIFLENVITGIALLKARNLKIVFKYCLINLTIIDAITSLVYFYHSVVVYNIIDAYVECYIRYAFVGILGTLSMFTVVTMTFERLLALYAPFRYDSLVTRRNLAVYLVLCWIIGSAISFLALYESNRNIKVCNWLELVSSSTKLVYGLSTALSIIFICGGNIIVFITARKHIKAILPVTAGENITAKSSKMNLKATITTISVVLPAIAISLPFSIFCVYISYKPSNTTETICIVNCLYSLGIINSFINPLIYSWRLEELRNSLKSLIRKERNFIVPDI